MSNDTSMGAVSKHEIATDVAPAARVAVIGCGWWAQGWHLPHLAANSPSVKIVAVVDTAPKLVSTLSSSPLLCLDLLSEKYQCPCYTSVSQMLEDVGPALDGAIIATSHASHFEVGMLLLNEGIRRRRIEEDGGQGKDKTHRILNILMEKPMTTDVNEARRLWEMSSKGYPEGAFIINHTANYRPQTQIARHIIASNQIGKIRHISAYMNGPLMWLFNDSSNHSWVSKTPWKNTTSSNEENETTDDRSPLPGNGYAYGQVAHLIAWIYAVLGAGEKSDAEEIAVPTKVYCNMSHAPKTGADISFAAVITCCDDVTFALSGTALLPGSQYADPPIGKHINIELFGEVGSLMYGGDDKIPGSGRLELRRSEIGKKCQPEYPCSDQDWSGLLREGTGMEFNMSEIKDKFYFEDGDQEGIGPGSLKAFLDACRNSCKGTKTPINDSFVGLRTVQIIDAMYRSSISGNAEEIDI